MSDRTDIGPLALGGSVTCDVILGQAGSADEANALIAQ